MAGRSHSGEPDTKTKTFDLVISTVVVVVSGITRFPLGRPINMESLAELNGYLLKKSRQGRYQKRWFEATSHYLTYYKGLKARQVKQEGAISDSYSHHEECYNDTSSEVSSVYNDDTRASLGPNSRPTFAALDREEAAAQALVGASVRHAPPPPIIPLQTKASASFRLAAPPVVPAAVPPPSPYFSAPPPQVHKAHDNDDKVTVCCGRCQFM
ncbi:hypothetical protein DYB25_010699 [Aphanomyces astaci]|uniref:PH domain-containing protein n=3 Tax=Aphanomyces astaci TaxID=112090 RepID=A0A397BW53_APHAT|nr:hypothetical protein DYB25_010699 [Aphanomyces astaci]RHY49036.1 hypothetical protein DYB34_009508 [Aphanomyces astaci]